jgi:hypothetical protein
MITVNLLITLVATTPSAAAAEPVVRAPASCENFQALGTETAGDSLWHGVFVLDSAQSADLEAVAEQAASQVGGIARGRARARLRERLEAAECLRLADDGSVITIESERGLVWRVNRSGTVETSAVRASETRTQHATVSDRTITITGRGEKGEGRYELQRSSDGKRLNLDVSLAPKRLAQPIAYTLVYESRTDTLGAR